MHADCVDGKWGPWSLWSECNCKTGLKTRDRHVSSPSNFCGIPVSGISEEHASCKEQCGANDDCLFSPWHEWKGCSQTCGGGQSYRFRNIERNAQGLGKRCQGN